MYMSCLQKKPAKIDFAEETLPFRNLSHRSSDH